MLTVFGQFSAPFAHFVLTALEDRLDSDEDHEVDAWWVCIKNEARATSSEQSNRTYGTVHTRVTKGRITKLSTQGSMWQYGRKCMIRCTSAHDKRRWRRSMSLDIGKTKQVVNHTIRQCHRGAEEIEQARSRTLGKTNSQGYHLAYNRTLTKS